MRPNTNETVALVHGAAHTDPLTALAAALLALPADQRARLAIVGRIIVRLGVRGLSLNESFQLPRLMPVLATGGIESTY